jgi:hypothetical protein
MSGDTENLSLLLAAGAATAGVSAVDCGDRETMTLMLAGGVEWTSREMEAIRFDEDSYDSGACNSDDFIDNSDELIELALRQWGYKIYDSERALAKIRSQVPAAKKRIERAGFAAICARVLEICVALQEIEMPAPQLIEIVTHACAPFAAQLPYHYLWDAVVLVKHFRSRKAK